MAFGRECPNTAVVAPNQRCRRLARAGQTDVIGVHGDDSAVQSRLSAVSAAHSNIDTDSILETFSSGMRIIQGVHVEIRNTFIDVFAEEELAIEDSWLHLSRSVRQKRLRSCPASLGAENSDADGEADQAQPNNACAGTLTDLKQCCETIEFCELRHDLYLGGNERATSPEMPGNELDLESHCENALSQSDEVPTKLCSEVPKCTRKCSRSRGSRGARSNRRKKVGTCKVTTSEKLAASKELRGQDVTCDGDADVITQNTLLLEPNNAKTGAELRTEEPLRAEVPRSSRSAKHSRLWCHVNLDEEMTKGGFELVPILLGHGGHHMREIWQATSAKVRVRGRGSGHKEPNGREANTHLMIAIVMDPICAEFRMKFRDAVALVSRRLQKVCSRFEEFFARIHGVRPNGERFWLGEASPEAFEILEDLKLPRSAVLTAATSVAQESGCVENIAGNRRYGAVGRANRDEMQAHTHQGQKTQRRLTEIRRPASGVDAEGKQTVEVLLATFKSMQ